MDPAFEDGRRRGYRARFSDSRVRRRVGRDPPARQISVTGRLAARPEGPEHGINLRDECCAYPLQQLGDRGSGARGAAAVDR
jgi:hypothetical protein